MKKLLLVALAARTLGVTIGLVLGGLTFSAKADAVVPACAELKWINVGSRHAGGSAWCAGHAKWQVFVGCGNGVGPVITTVVGPINTRWASEARCPAKYNVAYWVSYRTQG